MSKQTKPPRKPIGIHNIGTMKNLTIVNPTVRGDMDFLVNEGDIDAATLEAADIDLSPIGSALRADLDRAWQINRHLPPEHRTPFLVAIHDFHSPDEGKKQKGMAVMKSLYENLAIPLLRDFLRGQFDIHG